MPIVMVRFGPKFSVDESEASVEDDLWEKLPEIIVRHLGVPGTQAELKRDEIEVWFEKPDKRDVANGKRLQILILANDYPERREILEKGAEKKIAEDLAAIMPRHLKGKCFVWIRLAPGFYAEF